MSRDRIFEEHGFIERVAYDALLAERDSLSRQARDSHEACLRAWAEVRRLRDALRLIASARNISGRDGLKDIAREALASGVVPPAESA